MVICNYYSNLVLNLKPLKFINMKKLIITCTLIASVSGVCMAQVKKTNNATANKTSSSNAAVTAESKAEKIAKSLETKLGLNAEQYKKVYDAEFFYIKQDEVARENGGVPGEGELQQMAQSRDENIKRALTADQYTKYAAMNSKAVAAPKK